MAAVRASYPARNQAPRVVCLGETMLMFAPPRFELIEQCDQFQAYVGGSEANVAIGLERLGMHAGWIGKLPDNALGHKVDNQTRAYGVDTSACVWSASGRVGLFFVEWGAHPRPLKTIYDRAGSAASTLRPDELDWDYLGRAEWLHLTGITPALSDTCRTGCRQIILQARERGCKVSFDLNYRSLLWPPEAARAVYQDLLPHVNLLIATAADAALVLGRQDPGCAGREEMVQDLFHGFHPDAAAITCGADGGIAYDGHTIYTSHGYRVEVVNRLGAGDAFDAGLLYGYLTSGLQAGLDYGSAMAALKMTLPQNTPLIELEDVRRLLAGAGRDVVR